MKLIIEILKAVTEAYNRAVSYVASAIHNKVGEKCSTETIEHSVHVLMSFAVIMLMRQCPTFFSTVLMLVSTILVAVGAVGSVFDHMFAMAFPQFKEDKQQQPSAA